ncbi:MAG TPA: hypothetical protein VFE96_06715 [Candidatus Bathyarchaeia archaeon]|nr:hypothetical protein [Candidatus Bathyarchaeia archaeon]
MGRRRRRVIRIVKKKLPTVFTCPRCGEEAVRVTIDKQTGNATVLCALCQLKDEFPAHPAAQIIDVYSYFTDRFYGVKDPRPIIPREREHITPPPEEPEEPTLATQSEEAAPIEPALESARAETETSPAPVGPRAEASESVSTVAETPVPSPTPADETAPTMGQTPTAEEGTEPQEVQGKNESEDEAEPFADILGENKDKKRYSPNPLPQSSEQG